MPENLTLNPQDTRTFDAGLASVSVGVGSVVITEGRTPTIIEDGETAGPFEPSSALYSPDGAILSVTYANEISASQEPAEQATGVSSKKRVKKAA